MSEKKVTREEEYELEREPKVIVKKKGGWGGKIIALSLGFVIGAGSLVGGVAALGYWALSSPIKNVENKAQSFVPNLDLQQYLTQEYYDGNVLKLIGGIRDVINDISAGEGGFAELAQISPKVKDAVRSLAKNMKKLGSNIEEDAIYDSLMNTPFSSLGGYLSNTLLKSVEVGPMLLGANAFEFDVLTQDKLMMALLYGVEGEDYVLITETDENGNETKKIAWVDGGRKPLSIGEIQDDGVTAALSYLPVDSLLTVNEGDGMMASLAYGASSHYTYIDKLDEKGQVVKDEEGNPVRVVQMNARVYTSADNEKFYDEDGNELACTAAPLQGATDIYVLTFKDGENNVTDVQYAKLRKSETQALAATLEGEEKLYDIYKDEACVKPLRYKKTTVTDLMETPEDLLGTMEIATVMGLNGQGNLNPILAALAYGEENVDFIWVHKEINGAIEKDENGEPIQYVQLLPGKKPKLIQSLQGDNLDTLVTDLPLSSIIDVSTDDSMMMSLAYGSSNKYEIKEKQIGVDQDDNPIIEKYVEMKQVEYTCKEGVWRNIDGDMIDAVYNESDGTLTITSTDGDGGFTSETLHVVCDNAAQKYLVVDESGKAVTYEKTTVGTLQNEPSSLIDQIELGEMLDVHPEDENPDKLMLALAYGNKGEHYDFDVEGNFYFKEVDGKTCKPRTLGDLRNDKELFKTIYIGDALEVNSTSHSVLVAIAYGEEGVDFDWGEPKLDEENNPVLVNGQEVREPVMRAGKKPRSIEQLQGSNSDGLINSITLESALGIDANSEAMMRSLAFGQEGVHYENIEYTEVDGKLVAVHEKVIMKHASYTPEFEEDSNTIVAFYNRIDEKVTKETPTPVAGQDGTYKIVLTDDSVQYVKKDANGEYKVYAEDGTTEVPYAKTTLGQLSHNSSAVMDDVTLADTLGVDENETDKLKKSLAYSKDGHAYTIGELSDDPQSIVNNLQLDTVIDPEKDNAMTMYLLYGKEGVHYQISEPTKTADIPKDAPILPDTVNEENDTAQYIIMLHQKMTVHQKQDHNTLDYIYEEDTNGLYVKDGDSYRLATSTDLGTRYSAVYCVHNEYGESIFEDENGATASNHPVLKELSVAEQTAYGNVVIDGYDCTVKFTYTLDDEPNTIYRLLLPDEGQPPAIADVRVKGYYTYNHYEKAYFLQSASITDEVVGEWTSYTYEANTLASFTDAGLMTHLTERLTLEEVLGSTVKDNTILKSIAHTTIDELPGAVDSLTIAQVFEENVYKTEVIDGVRVFVDEGYEGYEGGNRLYYNEANGKWYTTESFQAGTESKRALTGTWKYLLRDATPYYEEDENGTYVKDTIVDGKEVYRAATNEELTNPSVQKYAQAFTAPEEYKVTEIGGLVENMTHNIQNATLDELYKDGIIVLTDEDILDTGIMYKVLGTPVCNHFKDEKGNDKTTLGQLTITEMITYISKLLDAVSTP